MPGTQSVRITGSFSVEELTGDYSSERYAFARRLGDTVGSISVGDWRVVEPLLRALWFERPEEPTWEQARPAVFLAWKQAQQLTDGSGNGRPPSAG